MRMKIIFISGLIDGDGSVKKKDGCICIRATQGWMIDLENLLNAIEIQTGGCRVERILDSGKTYWRISIHRGDFVSAGGKCFIKEKQDRILRIA